MHIQSIDFDDTGNLCMTTESDESLQIYKVQEGAHDKSLASKKYGAKLARFTHANSSIIYASTKVNDAIRYLHMHDNSFGRYFEGHEGPVTAIEMHPGSDNFISCSKDNTVRLWNAQSRNAQGILYLNNPYLSAWDPSGTVFAVGSPPAGTILLYDYRNFQKVPMAEIDVVEQCHEVDQAHVLQGWTKLSFSNDGKWILLGTIGNGHFVFDAFEYKLKAYLHKPDGGCSRPGVGEDANHGLESSGDCAFTADGRFVISGSKKNVLIWDILSPVGDKKVLEPKHVLEDKREAAVLAVNPRYNFFATADQQLMVRDISPV